MMNPMISRLCLVLALALATALPARAAFETRATAAWVYDVTTRTVLLSKNAETPLPPASMSKLMTLNMLFEALRSNDTVTMDTRFSVSDEATAIGGSSMYLKVTDRPTVEELIQGIIVQSGNDACVVVAEGLAGTEDAFSIAMTKRAESLGMNHSVFKNASGWPEDGHVMSMEDLGILATRLIVDFPEYYGYFAQTSFEYDGRVPANHNNRNPLLGLGNGADGLKTGHTREAGYGLVGSAAQGDRRIVFVITGLETDKARAEEAERIVNWGFRQFVQRTIVTKGQEITCADVWLGLAPQVGLVAAEDINVLVPALHQEGLSGNAMFIGPIKAPITAGQEIGELLVTLDGLPDARVTLLADRDVGQAGFFARLRLAAKRLMGEFAVEAAGAR